MNLLTRSIHHLNTKGGDMNCRSLLLLIAALPFSAQWLVAQPVTFPVQELVGRPTNTSVTINVVADQALDAYFEYGTQPGLYTSQTTAVSATANNPIEVIINGLQTNTRYYYRMVYRKTGNMAWTQRTEHSFQTQRSPG